MKNGYTADGVVGPKDVEALVNTGKNAEGTAESTSTA